MFDALRSIFQRTGCHRASMEPKLAVAALLVHLAAVDGGVKPEEREAVKGALMDYYGLGEDEVES